MKVLVANIIINLHSPGRQQLTQRTKRTNSGKRSTKRTKLSSSDIAECCVGQMWPKVEGDILQTL